MASHARIHPKDMTSRTPTWALAVQTISAWLLVAAWLTGATFAWAYWAVGLDTSTVSKRLESASSRTFTTGSADKVAELTSTGTPPTEAWNAKENELLGYIRLPSVSPTLRLPIQEGTDKTVLDMMGAGHLHGTAMAGQAGNMFLAGHATYTDFAGITGMKPGDRIIIEGQDWWWVYEATTSPDIVSMYDVAEAAPGAAGTRYGITLQTCWPIMSTTPATQRVIVHGRLAGWAAKKDGVPADIARDSRTTVSRLVRHVETVGERVGMPVTGVAGLGLTVMWLLLAFIGWLASHRHMIRVEWKRGPVFDPFSWTWRLTPGLWPSNRVVFTLTRLIPYTLLLAGVTFIMFRWACPWLADTFLPDQIAHPGF